MLHNVFNEGLINAMWQIMAKAEQVQPTLWQNRICADIEILHITKQGAIETI